MVNCSSSTAGVDNTVVHQQTTTIIPDNDVDNNTEDESLLQFTPFILRLHLIRHGETIANVQNIVLGQGDSPLTDNGLILAQMASESPSINGRMINDDDSDRSSHYYYWRTYCSDLHRAHRTARIVLCLEDIHGTEIEQLASDDSNGDNSNRRSINLIVEPRLRELAKGAREGYPKSLSYEEAVARRIQEADDGSNSDDNEIPLLESIDDAWERVKDWIDSLVTDASIEYGAEANNRIDESCNDANSNDGTTEKVYNVFGLSHSALIRTMIHRAENYSLTKEGSLRIPNLSRTIIDVRPYKVKGSRDDALRWKCRLLHFTDVSHLSDEPSRNFHQGAPYL
ncbi:hypothetical protein ACHAWC_001204 [Mediolabrus comicus]